MSSDPNNQAPPVNEYNTSVSETEEKNTDTNTNTETKTEDVTEFEDNSNLEEDEKTSDDEKTKTDDENLTGFAGNDDDMISSEPEP